MWILPTMRTLGLLALLLLPGCYFSAATARHSVSEDHGAWTIAQIDKTDWPDAVKLHCKNRRVLPGMTTTQTTAAWGNPDSELTVNGVAVWVYERPDMGSFDGSHTPSLTIRFDAQRLVLSVNPAG